MEIEHQLIEPQVDNATVQSSNNQKQPVNKQELTIQQTPQKNTLIGYEPAGYDDWFWGEYNSRDAEDGIIVSLKSLIF